MKALPEAITLATSRRLTWREFREAAKARFGHELRERYWLRLHVVVILAGAVSAGALTSAIALDSGIHSMPLRYLLGLGAAYLTLLGLVRIWIDYVGGWRPDPDAPNPLDLYDPCWTPESGLELAGGRFGGGGASGNWGGACRPSSDAGNGSSGFSLDLDDAVLIVVLAALVFVLLGGIAYFVAVGPAVLTEAAFEVALAGALAGRTKALTAGRWLDRLVGSTIVPFLVVAALTALCALFAQELCPDALKLRDVFGCVGR